MAIENQSGKSAESHCGEYRNGKHSRRRYEKIITLTVMIASGMGGIAGILVGMAFNSVSPQMGLSMGLKGLAIIILGEWEA